MDDFEIMNKDADKMMSSEDINLVFAAASQENEELIKNVKIETLDLKREVDVGEQKITKEELVVAQKNDKVISPIYQILNEKLDLKKSERKLLGNASITLLKQRKKLYFQNDVLYRKTKTLNQIVLPERFHSLVYTELHEKLAHLSSERVLELARDRFSWPQMKNDIEHYIRKRCRCILSYGIRISNTSFQLFPVSQDLECYVGLTFGLGLCSVQVYICNLGVVM